MEIVMAAARRRLGNRHKVNCEAKSVSVGALIHLPIDSVVSAV